MKKLFSILILFLCLSVTLAAEQRAFVLGCYSGRPRESSGYYTQTIAEFQAMLKDGWKVVSATPVVDGNDTRSIVYILEK